MLSIETIAVIGATPRGRAIAQLALAAGYTTVLEDFSPRALEDARTSLKPILPEHAFMKLRSTTSIEDALRGADLVIEAAADEMETKIELFTIFDKFAKPKAILASSSLALPIEDMASVTFCAERCVGIHFPQMPESVNAIQIVATTQTSAAVVACCVEVARRMGKHARVVQQSGTGA